MRTRHRRRKRSLARERGRKRRPNDHALAIRASNIVSFAVLFYSGYEWGKYTGTNPLRTGLVLVAVGVLLVAIAIPFGG